MYTHAYAKGISLAICPKIDNATPGYSEKEHSTRYKGGKGTGEVLPVRRAATGIK